jgi:hypothetical protein
VAEFLANRAIRICLPQKFTRVQVSSLVPHLIGLQVRQLILEDERLTLMVVSTRRTGTYPVCQRKSSRIHSHDERTLSNAPDHSSAVRSQRRFRSLHKLTLNAVVVTAWQGEGYAQGDEKVFLTSLPVAQPLVVLDLYDLRSLIENTGVPFGSRELKQCWSLESYPKKTADAVRGHVFLTLVTFTLANAFRTKQGQDLARHGVRRQRAEEQTSKVIIFAGEYYAIFEIEEVFILLGVVPTLCFTADPAHVRHRYAPSLVA